jgi:hypothetical protein
VESGSSISSISTSRSSVSHASSIVVCAGLFINSIVAAKRCPRVVYPKAGQFGQVLVSAKLHADAAPCRPWQHKRK